MNQPEPQESIAIIGMSGRFPKARDLAEFWHNLRHGVEAVSFFADAEAQWLPIEHAPNLKDPRYVKARAVLERPEWFDAAFFGMNPQEARVMDPQHRVFLECAWEALEAAGCNPETYPGLIGVFAGASMNTYLFTNLLTNPNLVADVGLFPTMIANDGDFVPTRVSYKFNLRGPSINLQTACSTSLVAVCTAVQNLLGYRCDVALAGGVSITFPPNRGQHHLEGGILSPDGHCRAFDAQAAGTVLGDGAGVVVLKRLSDALADGDTICAVIKGTAINNDGAVKIGYTAPSIDGQAEVIAMAQAEAGFAPETVSYIEAHGTGTPLGDPIEIAGLTKAFGLGGERGQFCAIGSVKSNIGHLDIGAGVAGLIKTVLALQHGEIPPSLHFEQPNPKIDFAGSPFFVNATLRPWPKSGTPRRAGVSSFGIGGTNSHVAIEEAPDLPTTSPARPGALLVLSARTATALETATDNLAAHLEQNPSLDLADVAFTLQAGRKVFAHRRAVVCDSAADAVRALTLRDPKRVVQGADDREAPPVAFLFPGQGSQAIGMARELYDTEPELRRQIDHSCDLLRPRLGLDLREIIFPSPEKSEIAAKLLGETRLTQPALFVVEHALAQLWQQWGVKPSALLGHSLGEYVAACVAGVFPLEDALALVAERARLMQAQPPGAMVAVRAAEARIGEFLGNNLALAAVNAPGLCVVSGPFDAIDALEQRLSASAIAFKRIATSHAFHSAMMEPVLQPLAGLLRKIKLSAPRIPLVSNVTGRWITDAEATSADYWATHLRQPVRFADGVATLMAGESRVLLEVGPGQTLAGLARQHPATANGAAKVLATLGRVRDGGSERSAMLHTLGELWVAGVRIAWRDGFYRDERRRSVPLPTYPFERKRHWVEPGPGAFLGFGQPTNGAAHTPVPAAGNRAANGVAANGSHSEAANGNRPAEPALARNRPTPAAAARGTSAELRALFQELSGIELADAGEAETFYQLGFDSLFLTQASLAVSKRFGIDVTFRQLREELMTFGKLAAHLDARSGALAPDDSAMPARDPQRSAAAAAEPAANSMNGSVGSNGSQPNGRAQDGTHGSEAPLTEPELKVSLTEAQREVWYACQFSAESSAAYNEGATLQFTGPLEVDALQAGLQQLVARHEALRTTFSANGEWQRIASAGSIEMPLVDLSGEEPQARVDSAERQIETLVHKPFDLVRGPLLRAALIRFEERRHWLVLAAHHLVCDGWSLAGLQRELAEFYSALVEGRTPVLPPAPSYAVHARQLAAAEPSPAFTAAGRYWREQFADGAPVLDLPADRPRQSTRSFAGGFFTRTLSAEAGAVVERLGAERDCTAFTVLFSAFNVLLHRLSGQDDLVVGVPSAGQVLGGLNGMVGHFANLLPVRSRLNRAQSFTGFLAATRDAMGSALEHWQFPFGRLVKELNLPRDASRVPLAPVVFNTVRHRGALAFSGLAAEPITTPKRRVNFDLTCNFAITRDGILVGCSYSEELFDAATIGRWFGHLETLLCSIGRNPDLPVGALPLLAETERQALLEEWNDTVAEYRRDVSIPGLFAEQVRRQPEAVAIVGERERLTYRMLDERAGRIARWLQAAGIRSEELVGVLLERTPDLVASILGVLKAGGAYVPLDPLAPAERLGFIGRDTGMKVILTQRSLAARLPAGSWQVVLIDDPLPVAEPAATAATGERIQPEHLAYVIYTSGSTGQPKGVCVTHRAVAALVGWARGWYEPAELDGVFYATSACFDVSVFESLVPLCLGGKIIVATNILQLGSHPAAGEASLISGVPSAVAELVRSGRIPPGVHTVNVAGEPCPQSLVEALYALPQIQRVYDLYGPTETTVYSTGSLRKRGGRATIGRPLPNEQAYVLDEHLQPVPIGTRGELYLGGEKLARGYLNRPELTRERFIEAPFLAGRRIYRTGDAARFLADGSLEYLGRLDHQVKIRGYRIELGEIEAALASHPEVAEAVAVARPDPAGALRLLAYVTARAASTPGGGLSIRALQDHLASRLPDYMMPAAITVLGQLPRTTSGKVDRRSLPEPDFQPLDEAPVAPRTTTEELLAEIWSEVLGVNPIGVHASFFELGGHSLLAARVIARVQAVLGVELTLQQFFSVPTIAGHAPLIDEALIEQITVAPDAETGAEMGAGALTAKDTP